MTPVRTSQHGVERPLEGARVCLIASNTLMFHRRFLQEIQALQDAGAHVRIVTQYEDDAAPDGIETHRVPLLTRRRLPIEDYIPQTSYAPSRLRRVAETKVYNGLRRLVFVPGIRKPLDVMLGREHRTAERIAVLEQMAPNVDIFWVIDYLNLETTVEVARRHGVRVVYETVDLIPEYHHMGERFRRRARVTERRLIPYVSGFITASDGYADYYEEVYRDVPGFRRPAVHDNAPDGAVDGINPTREHRRFLFLGALTFDRPIRQMIEACALAGPTIDLTFQGENYLGLMPQDVIAELGLTDRVRILEPCPVESVVETAAQYDIGIVALEGKDENQRRAGTTKVFTYMAAGLAILGSDLPGIARTIEAHQNGLLVGGVQPQDWAVGLSRIAALPATDLDRMKQCSLEGFAQHRWDNQKPLFVEEFRRALWNPQLAELESHRPATRR